MIGWCCTAFYPSCSRRLLVPPTHAADGESPHTLPVKKASVDFAAGYFNASADLFGPWDIPLTGGIFNVDGGMGLKKDVDLRFYLSDVEMDRDMTSGLNSSIHSAAMRLKWNPDANRAWAMTAGAGLGNSQGLWYYSFEHSQILGFENKYFIPYLNARVMANIPLTSRTIYLSGSYSKKPLPTLGFDGLMGFKIPLTHVVSYPPSLSFELGGGWLGDKRDDTKAILFDVKFEQPFDY